MARLRTPSRRLAGDRHSDRHGVRASALLNSEVVDHYPQIIEAGKARGWAWLAHGETNSAVHADMDGDAERIVLTRIVDHIQAATGKRPQAGWDLH